MHGSQCGGFSLPVSGQRLHVARQYVIMKVEPSHGPAQLLAESSVQAAIESVTAFMTFVMHVALSIHVHLHVRT